MYSSFHYPSLEKVWELEKKRSMALIVKHSDRKKQQEVQSEFIGGIHPNIDWTLEHLGELKTFTKAVRPWTVNEREKIEQCIKQSFAGIHTDFPEKALEIREEILAKG